MALLTSSLLPSSLNIKVKQYEHQPCCSQLHNFHRLSPKCHLKITMAQFWEPNKMKEQLNTIKERLWENSPDSVKAFPWKKTENLLLDKLLIAGNKALKLSIVTVFVFSCLSDFIYSISRNQELMIPFGLIVGVVMSDFLKQTSQEAFRSSEGKELEMKWQVLWMGGLFVVIKLVCAWFGIGTRVFLLHVANGGLMQVLWQWRSLLAENGPMEDGSTPSSAES
ncbi:hypothetical protein CXB51_001035 [Gossypium anomalum]|uniref:Uncharacterized protein n=1 Tax=Gossypium anomalum TaxID=47600 RepID=A0A8J5ZP51_9ROSI|nr:hypothetical protein CXB51_001035 [Gossypium anomalum]